MLHDTIHTYRYSSAEIARVFDVDVYQQIIRTDAFQRLKTIHFLGSIDYIIDASRRGVEERHTRFDHSLAVAALAQRYTKKADVPENDQENIVLAALMHDIGHAPLSHSMEPAFKTIFHIDHHIVGERILRGEVRLGRAVAKVLNRRGVNNFEIMSTIAGVGKEAARNLFGRQINVDTIEGITRSATYMYRQGLLQSPIVVLDALLELGKQSHDVLDCFWLLKQEVYSKLIQSRRGLIADLLCQRYVKINADDFESSYYYGTERELRADHRGLFEALKRLGQLDLVEPAFIADGEDVDFTRRTFVIDSSVALKAPSDIDRRYLQKKRIVKTQLRKRGGELTHGTIENTGSQGVLWADY